MEGINEDDLQVAWENLESGGGAICCVMISETAVREYGRRKGLSQGDCRHLHVPG